MSRYIDAEPYEQYLEEKIKLWRQREEEAHDQSMFEARRVHCALFYAKAQLKRMPTADVEKVRHGEWIALANGNMKHWKEKCSCCGAIGRGRPPYCRECGAKMDGNK